MKKLSKRFKKLIDISKNKKIESFDDLIPKVKANCNAKFDESVDVSFKLNLKNKKEESTLRTIVNLPNGNGKKIKIAVLCDNSKSNEAKAAGADFFEHESLIKDITNGKINFDKLIATPEMMKKIAKLGKVLGPKGLMPNPKLGTVTDNIGNAVKQIKSGQIEIKNDKDGNISASIGRKSFTDKKLKENYEAFKQTILKEKPTSIKGDYILSSFLTSTMGVSYQLKMKD